MKPRKQRENVTEIMCDRNCANASSTRDVSLICEINWKSAAHESSADKSGSNEPSAMQSHIIIIISWRCNYNLSIVLNMKF